MQVAKFNGLVFPTRQRRMGTIQLIRNTIRGEHSGGCGTERSQATRECQIITMNCQSLRRDDRWSSLNAIINTYQPDIIHLTETHLDEKIQSSEILQGNTNYDIIRKDRISRGGGVLIATHKNLIVSHERGFDTDCEIIWNKITLTDCKSIYTAAYYRPPNNDTQSLEALEESLAKISQHRTNPEIILTGDFNLPGISWDTPNNPIHSRPEYGAAVNNKMCEVINDNNLNQWVKENLITEQI